VWFVSVHQGVYYTEGKEKSVQQGEK